MSLKDDILAIDDLDSKIITVEKWGNKKIMIQSITAEQRYKLLDKCIDDKGNVDLTKLNVYTVIACACDPETGKQIFDYADYGKLKNKNAGAIDKIVNAANKINGLGEIQIKESEKN